MSRHAAPVAIGLALMAVGASAQTAPAPLSQNPNPWRPADAAAQIASPKETWIRPYQFFGVALDAARLRQILAAAPAESAQSVATSGALVVLPMPDGSFARFRMVESPIMSPTLAARFPQIKTFLGQGIDDPRAVVRFDLTPAGFHAQILAPGGAVYIDPLFRGDATNHASYYKHDYRAPTNEFRCEAFEIPAAHVPPAGPPRPAVSNGGHLRTYRLALAATSEYTRFYGGTVDGALAGMVTAINRVTGVYETEVGIRLQLVANEDAIIYTNAATDPYDNGSGTTMLSQNQSNLDAVIGDANYDVGHVFSTGGGGVAGIGVVCASGLKAWGVTGLSSPTGDAFYIDYVAHELGHEFGAHHPFNGLVNNCGNGNRYGPTAYEPGSGSTIMAYAGICGSDDLQPHSDPYFHSVSLEEIVAYSTTGMGGACPTLTASGSGTPTASAGPGYSIPAATPFVLTAAGSDSGGASLTYSWEERDLGPAAALNSPDNGSSPLFRSFRPTTNASRTFPQWSDLLNRRTTPGEQLPVMSRIMNFYVTARNNFAGGGGIDTSATQVTVVANGGPFAVTFPAAGGLGGPQTVTWNLGGTTNAPINTGFVNILLSTNGGLSFPLLLASNAPNTGSANVVFPDLNVANARLELLPVGNIFFNLNPSNFRIVPTNQLPVISAIAGQLTEENQPTSWIPFSIGDPDESASSLVVAGSSSDTNLVPATGFVFGGSGSNRTVSITPAPNTLGSAIITILVSDTNATSTTSFQLTMVAGNPPTLAPIPDRTIHPHSTLIISNAIYGGNPGSGVFAFTLDPGAPPGATIDANGVFVWTPGNAAPATAYRITISLADSDYPGFISSQTFTVNVVPDINISSSIPSNGTLTLSWNAIAGSAYRVQAASDLAAGNWSNLPPDVTATGPTASRTDALGSAPQRFYRILLLP